MAREERTVGKLERAVRYEIEYWADVEDKKLSVKQRNSIAEKLINADYIWQPLEEAIQEEVARL